MTKKVGEPFVRVSISFDEERRTVYTPFMVFTYEADIYYKKAYSFSIPVQNAILHGFEGASEFAKHSIETCIRKTIEPLEEDLRMKTKDMQQAVIEKSWRYIKWQKEIRKKDNK